MVWWNVYLDGKLIDEVPYVEGRDPEYWVDEDGTWYEDDALDAWYVTDSLVNHDGYDPRIVVRKQVREYRIMGTYPGGEREEVDFAETRDEAEYLLGEYAMAFGPEWQLEIEEVDDEQG
jgi:hypothetical protein